MQGYVRMGSRTGGPTRFRLKRVGAARPQRGGSVGGAARSSWAGAAAAAACRRQPAGARRRGDGAASGSTAGRQQAGSTAGAGCGGAGCSARPLRLHMYMLLQLLCCCVLNLFAQRRKCQQMHSKGCSPTSTGPCLLSGYRRSQFSKRLPALTPTAQRCRAALTPGTPPPPAAQPGAPLH